MNNDASSVAASKQKKLVPKETPVRLLAKKVAHFTPPSTALSSNDIVARHWEKAKGAKRTLSATMTQLGAGEVAFGPTLNKAL